jgi:hypothetical protein
VVTEGLAPPGRPTPHVLPPDVDGWEETAVAWLFDWAGVADWREVEVLARFPVVLARLASEHIDADVAPARRMWTKVEELAAAAGAAGSEQEAVTAALRNMLEREGPRLAGRARAAGPARGGIEGWQVGAPAVARPFARCRRCVGHHRCPRDAGQCQGAVEVAGFTRREVTTASMVNPWHPAGEGGGRDG